MYPRLFTLLLSLCLPLPLLATCHIIPFKLVDKLIIVRANIDGWKGNYILDTGIPNLLLNSQYFDGMASDKIHYGISGSATQIEVCFPGVQIGPVTWKKVYAGVVPLTHLERSLDLKLHGLLGCYLFRNYELTIDYVKEQLYLCEINRKGLPEEKHFHSEPLAVVPLSYKKSIPYVESHVYGEKLRLIIDTGAEINLLHAGMYSNVKDHVVPLSRLNLGGVGEEVISAQASTLNDLQVGQILCAPMKTAFLDLGKMNEGLPGVAIDGIVGYEFLSQFIITLNFRKNEMTIKERHPAQMIATVGE